MLNRFSRITILLTVWSVVAAGAEIGDVKFIQGENSRITEPFLKANTRVKPGMEYSSTMVNEDIKWLYNTGNFADVVAETKELLDKKIQVIYRLKTVKRIGKIIYQGQAKLTTMDLQKATTLEEGGLLNERALRETLQKIRKLYYDKGYRDATVNHAVIPNDQGGVDLTVKIAEHLRLKVHKVIFTGAKRFSQGELRKAISNQFSFVTYLPWISEYFQSGVFDRRELNLDKARLRDKYHDAGYLDFKVKDVKINPLPDDPEYVDLEFIIDEGEAYTIESVEITGNRTFDSAILLPLLKLKAGEKFSRVREIQSSQAVSSLYDTNGFVEMVCRPERSENFEKHTVKLNFIVEEGQKHFVRDVIIVGNTATKDKVIRRELAIQPGDPVAKNRIEVSRQRLLGMGYFTNVSADSINAEAVNEKDVRFTVQEKDERFNFRIGAGASDVNSVFGMAEISSDNFDITAPENFFYGGGQRMRIQGIYGFENAGANIDFVEPWFLDLPLRFDLSGYLNTTEFENWDETRLGVRSSLQRKIFDDFTTLAGGYKFEVVRVHNVHHRLKQYMHDNDLSGTFLVSQPFITLGRDTRDSLVDPTEGYNINFFSSISPQFLGSSSSYYRLEGKASYYTNFFDKALIFMIGGKVGTVAAFNRNEDVPVFERYFMGGSDSIRGFEYRSVGPYRCRENIGGQTMLMLTAELTHPIWGPIRGAIFADAGNAWRSSYTMNFTDINVGAGYGLRIKLPIIKAPLKLDLAYPVLKRQKEIKSKFRIHFNVGFSI